jgi:holo-[acyl-carrier protein] synthase
VIVGIGLDLVEIERVARMVSINEERALKRLFTFREVDYATRHANPTRHFAARLAAKEAAYKALSGNDLARAINWKDIEVVVRDDGQPLLELHGHAKRRAAEMGVSRAWVTLTHNESTAAAVVVLEGDGTPTVDPE